MKLNVIKDNSKASKKRKRLGRGSGSGLGKTCGSGTKGQKARTGVSIKGFEGGQMPLYQRLPKRGFKNIFSKSVGTVNLDYVQKALDSGRLNCDSNKITIQDLVDARLVRRNVQEVKVLGFSDLRNSLIFEVHSVSQSARKCIENVGGSLCLLKSE